MTALQLREVGPRDGIQREAPLSVADRVALIERLIGNGVREIEIGSFVSPKAVPAMAGTEDVVAALASSDVVFWALVPNLIGAQRAWGSGITALSFTASASPTYSERNVGMTVEESLTQLQAIADAAGDGVIDCVISCAFGSPYEGDIEPALSAALGARALDAGATRVTYADTTGMATPHRIDLLLAQVGNEPGLHLHDTRGTALVNAVHAFRRGVRRFDTAVGGLGGSPFSAHVGGNLATEALVHLLQDESAASGFDVDGLIETARWLQDRVGHPVPSRLVEVGPRWQRAQ